MALVMGVDPGVDGAVALCDSDGRISSVEDLPTWKMPVGKGFRKRIDAVELDERMEVAKLMGVELVVIEAVGGRPRQSASGGFVFGYTVGLIYMACIHHRIAIETVQPQVWKAMLRVKGKGRATDDMIIQRADEMFPDHRMEWRGPKGGLKVDRAEAAMLSYFGATQVLYSAGTAKEDIELRTVYKFADTGA